MRKKRVILIANQKGGVGKTTLSLNIAKVLASDEKLKIGIIDIDYQSSLSQLSEMEKEVDIFNLEPGENLQTIKEKDYDFIIIDTPPYHVENLPELCEIADVIVVPLKASVLDLFATKPSLNIIKKSGNINKVLVVFNMVKPKTTLTKEVQDEVEKLNVNISNVLVGDLVAFNRAVLYGLDESDAKERAQIQELIREIIVLMIK